MMIVSAKRRGTAAAAAVASTSNFMAVVLPAPLLHCHERFRLNRSASNQSQPNNALI